MNNFEIKGQPIRTSLVVDKKSGFDQKANVIVKNLHSEITQLDAHELFSKFGKIISTKLETF